MARQSNTPLVDRVQADSRIGASSLAVVASPVNTVGNPQAAEDQQLSAFTQAMANFTGAFDALADQKSQEFIQEETQRALADGSKEFNGAEQPAFTSEQTPWYKEARMGVWGMRKGVELSAQLEADYQALKADPSKFASTDLNEWVNQYTQEKLKGLDDPIALPKITENLSRIQARISAEGLLEQQALRAAETLENFGSAAQQALINEGFSAESLEAQIPQARQAGVPVKDLVQYYINAANYGISRGLPGSATFLDTPLKALDGQTLRTVATLKDQDAIDSLVGRGNSEKEKRRLENFSVQYSDKLLRSPSPELIKEMYQEGLRLGLTRQEVSQVVEAGVSGHVNLLGDSPEDLQKVTSMNSLLLNPEITGLGASVRGLSASGTQAQIDRGIAAESSAQRRILNEATAEAEQERRIAVDEALRAGNLSSIGVDGNDPNSVMRFAMSFKSGQVEMYSKIRQAAVKQNEVVVHSDSYVAGRIQSIPGLTDKEKSDVALKWEAGILANPSLRPEERVLKVVSQASLNNMASPSVKNALSNLETLPHYVKGEDGTEVFNPQLRESLLYLQAVAKSDNPQALSHYVQGDSLVFMNAVMELTGEGKSMEEALSTVKSNMDPTRRKDLDKYLKQGVADLSDSLASRFKEGTDTLGSFFDAKIRNPGAFEAELGPVMRMAWITSGGDIERASKIVEKVMADRAVVVVTEKNTILANEGQALLLPPGIPNSRTTSSAIQEFFDEWKAKDPNAEYVITSRASTRGDTTLVITGGGREVRRPLSQILSEYERLKASKAAVAVNPGYTPEQRALFEGRTDVKTYRQQAEARMSAERAALEGSMQKVDPLSGLLKGGFGAPVRGSGPTSGYGLANQFADSDPAFALGAAAEGFSSRSYQDNDGGVTLGMGYNTRHQKPEQILKDFKKAGLPHSEGYLQALKDGSVALTVNEQRALHSVVFQRYQENTRKVFEEQFPGAWDALDTYQKAALGQLAYNTGWNSSILKKFLTKVGQGREEEALSELKITYKDGKTGERKVNTKLMSLVRAMWDGPSAFKQALTMK